MTEEHKNRLDWAVDALRETPALPDGFLERFEAKLAEEATPPKCLSRAVLSRLLPDAHGLVDSWQR